MRPTLRGEGAVRCFSPLPDPRRRGLDTSPEPDKGACNFTREFRLAQLLAAHGLLHLFFFFADSGLRLLRGGARRRKGRSV